MSVHAHGLLTSAVRLVLVALEHTDSKLAPADAVVRAEV